MTDVYSRKSLPFREIDGYSIAHIGERRAFLNKDGTRIFRMLDGVKDAAAIAHELGAERGCPAELTEELFVPKVNAYLRTLHREGLIQERGGARPEKEHAEQPAAVAGKDRFGSKVRSVQEFCATPKAFAAGAHDSIEKQIDALYWKQHYIQKMHLEVTYRCNFRCVHCYNTTHAGAEKELRPSEWEQVLDQLAGLGCYLVIFTGGEVFVRKDAVGIFYAACERGFSFRLNTNGSLINEQMIAAFEPMRPYLQAVDISLYGATPDVHDSLARRPGSYQNTIRGIMLLREAGINLVAKYVTMRDNFAGIPRFEADMEKLGVPYVVHTGSVIPQTDRSQAPFVQLLSDAQYKELVALRNAGRDQEPQHCRPGHVRGAVTPDGHVSPCEWLTDFKLGNIREQSLREIWYGEKFLNFRKGFEQEAECPSCSLRGGCERCPAHSYLETGNLLQCAPVRRHNAEIVEAFDREQAGRERILA